MIHTILITAILLCIGFVTDVNCQTSAQQRTAELVSQLDKTKYKKKDKGAVHIELYVDIKNTPDVRPVAEYSGHYETPLPGNGYVLDLQVTLNGAATGSGTDIYGVQGIPRKFTLRDAKVEGARLTGTKVFENGETEPFEAVFVTEVTRSGKTEADATVTQTMSGIGYIQKTDTWNSRVFMEKK
jgi:cell division protein FtsX